MVIPRRKHTKIPDQSSNSNIDDRFKYNVANKKENVSSFPTEKKIKEQKELNKYQKISKTN